MEQQHTFSNPSLKQGISHQTKVESAIAAKRETERKERLSDLVEAEAEAIHADAETLTDLVGDDLLQLIKIMRPLIKENDTALMGMELFDFIDDRVQGLAATRAVAKLESLEAWD